MPADRPDYSVTGRGIEFVLTFKNKAEKALREAGSQMEQLAKGAGGFLRQATDLTTRGMTMLTKMRQDGEKAPGYVTAFGMSVKTPQILRQAWEWVTKLGNTIFDKLRRQRQAEDTLTDSMKAQTKETERLQKAQEGVDKSSESLIQRFGKLALEAYGMKKAIDLSINAATEAMEMDREIARINIGRTQDVNKLGNIGDQTDQTRMKLLLLIHDTRATREEAMQTFRVLSNLEIDLDHAGEQMATVGLQFSRFTGIGVDELLHFQQMLIKTLKIPPEQVPDFVRVMSEAVVQVKHVFGSYDEAFNWMKQVAPAAIKVASVVGTANRMTDESIHELAQNTIFNAAAMSAAFKKFGADADEVPRILERMSRYGTSDMQKFIGVIASQSGIPADEIKTGIEQGNLLPLTRGITGAAKKMTFAQMEKYAPGMMQEYLGPNADIQYAILAQNAAQIVETQRQAQESMKNIHPGDWDKRWAVFSETIGEVVRQFSALADIMAVTFGEGMLSQVAGMLRTINDFLERHPLIDPKTEKLTPLGQGIKNEGVVGAWITGGFGSIAAFKGAKKFLTMIGVIKKVAPVVKEAEIAVEGLAGVNSLEAIGKVTTKMGLFGRAIFAVKEAVLDLVIAFEAGEGLQAIGAMILNPWLIIPGLVIGATYLVVKYWDKIKEAGEGMQMFAGDLKGLFVDLWDISGIQKYIEFARNKLGELVAWVDQNTPEWLKKLWAPPPAPATKINDAVGDVAKDLTTGAPTIGWNQTQSMRDEIDRLVNAGYTQQQAEAAFAKGGARQRSPVPQDTLAQMATPDQIGVGSGFTAEVPDQQTPDIDFTKTISEIIAAQVAGQAAPIAASDTPSDTRSIFGSADKPVRVDNRDVVRAVASQTDQTTKILSEILDALSRSQPDEKTGLLRRNQL